jgi:uncharacterized cofD-like protein
MLRPKKHPNYYLKWLLPGLDMKRWLVLLSMGSLFFVVGLALWLNLQPITWLINQLRELAQQWPAPVSGPFLMVIGFFLTLVGVHKLRKAVNAIAGSKEAIWLIDLLEKFHRRYRLERGPNIVAIGGGTGLSTLLRGIKLYTSNITSIVTVGDDGGSSGRLRQQQGIIPPGDIRNCIAALADEEQLLTALFQYRFKGASDLGGHSFGNLFLTAMCHVTGDMMSAIKESSTVLNIRGRVLPSTLEQITLVATLADGSEVRGESHIPEAQQAIKHLRCEPDNPQPLPEAIEAIRNADLILYGPGSLYTSVLPNLLIPDIQAALLQSRAAKLYICNAMTQPGETDDYSAAQHVETLLHHTGNPRLVDAVLLNLTLPDALVERYQSVGGHPVAHDDERLAQLGVEVLRRQVVPLDENTIIRHDPKRLARAIIRWFLAKRKQHQPKAASSLSLVTRLKRRHWRAQPLV